MNPDHFEDDSGNYSYRIAVQSTNFPYEVQHYWLRFDLVTVDGVFSPIIFYGVHM